MKLLHQIFLWVWWTTLLFILGWTYYGGIIRFDYPVPPRDDGIRHMTYAKEKAKTGFSQEHEVSNFGPPGFHLFLAALSKLSGQDIVIVTVWLMPLIAINTVGAVYLLMFFWFLKKHQPFSVLRYLPYFHRSQVKSTKMEHN